MSRRRLYTGCRVEGCDRPHAARGYCNACYGALRYRGQLDELPTEVRQLRRPAPVRLPRPTRYPLASLRELLERNRLHYFDGPESVTEMAKRLGLSRPTVHRILHSPNKTVSFQTADEVCTAVGYYVEHLEVAS